MVVKVVFWFPYFSKNHLMKKQLKEILGKEKWSRWSRWFFFQLYIYVCKKKYYLYIFFIFFSITLNQVLKKTTLTTHICSALFLLLFLGWFSGFKKPP
jgi:hypothetical protein